MGSTTSKPDPIFAPVATVKTNVNTDARSRRLIYLLRANHINHSLQYSHLRFHNHTPHILGSAYLLGASSEQLTDIFDEESKELESWPESPEQIAPDDWKAHLGDKTYQKAYLDFFDEEVVKRNNDWKATVFHFLTDGDKPLLNCLIGGLGHPLIHLGYAFEIESREIAVEALTLAAVNYSRLHEYVDNPRPPIPYQHSIYPLDLLSRIREDTQLDGVLSAPGDSNIDKLLDTQEGRLRLYFNSLVMRFEDLAVIYERLVEAVTLVFVTGHRRGDPQFDFFLVHLVTTAHAMRIVLPLLTLQQAWHVLRSHWVIVVIIYIAQMRPLIKKDLLNDVSVDGKDWEYVQQKALEGDHKLDAHYVKALRAFLEFEKLFGDKDGFYLKAAVKVADEFKGWVFGEEDPELDIKK